VACNGAHLWGAMDALTVFDRAQLRHARRRGGRLGDPGLAEAAEARLLDRLDDVRRGFTRALVITPRPGSLPASLAGRGVGFVAELALDGPRPGSVLGDEEFLPFGVAAFDLVLAPFCLHWTNDLPGCLLQLRRALVPDGLLLANLPGVGTLAELRTALLDAEVAASGGAHPRVSPFADLRDAAGLLQRAGFALPVADLDRLTLAYRDPITLLRELRASGETNAVLARARRPLRRGVLFRALAALPRDAAGRAAVAVELITLSGWAPAATQQLPARRGSATFRLADALGAAEHPAGDSAGGDAVEPV
jgi:NADH dehydrogenase [ubiquinone] 1 alpha subcomplex assembly factor 5